MSESLSELTQSPSSSSTSETSATEESLSSIPSQFEGGASSSSSSSSDSEVIVTQAEEAPTVEVRDSTQLPSELRESNALCKSLEDPLTFETFTNPVLTPCNHRFDRDSISEWLSTGENTCPLCRAVLTKRDLRPDNTTRTRLGLEEKSQLTPEGSEATPPAGQGMNEYEVHIDREAQQEIAAGELTCCGIDHAEKCSSCFCIFARRVESSPSSIVCWNFFLGGFFARKTMGSQSTPASRSVCGTLWPLWALLTLIFYVIEICFRVFVVLAVLMIAFVVLVILVAVVFIIVAILLVCLLWCVVIGIISCILCWPCYLLYCCCRCCLVAVEATM